VSAFRLAGAGIAPLESQGTDLQPAIRTREDWRRRWPLTDSSAKTCWGAERTATFRWRWTFPSRRRWTDRDRGRRARFRGDPTGLLGNGDAGASTSAFGDRQGRWESAAHCGMVDTACNRLNQQTESHVLERTNLPNVSRADGRMRYPKDCRGTSQLVACPAVRAQI
jgi:hypothetical protein